MPNSWNRFFRLLPPCQGHILWPNKRLEKKLQCARTKPGITHIRTHLSPSPSKSRGPFCSPFVSWRGEALDADRNEEEYLGKARNAMRFRRHGVWTRNHALRFAVRSAVAQSRFRELDRKHGVRPAFSRFPEFVDSCPFPFVFSSFSLRAKIRRGSILVASVFLLLSFSRFSCYNIF